MVPVRRLEERWAFILLSINPALKKPLYVQVYQLLKKKIQQKTFKRNEKLPSKRKLAKKNHISENTVMAAYNQLLIEGYIYSIERKGFYVSNIEFHNLSPQLNPQKEEIAANSIEYDYDFTRSNPDQALFPYSVFSKIYRQLFEKSKDLLIEESDGQGLYTLRDELQKYLSISRGVPCSADQIILGPSSEYLLSILFQLVDKKLHIGLEDPGYQGFQSLIQRLKLPFKPIRLSKGGLKLDDLRKSKVNLMIVTSNHQFPTGKIMPLKTRQALLKWASESPNRYIVENDYDSEFKYSGIPIPSLKYLDQKDQVIHLSSFTRILSPGIRMAYMVLPKKLAHQYQKLYTNHSASLSSLEQWLIRDFIAEGHLEKHLNRSRTFYKRKRDLFIQTIYNYDPQAEIFGEEAGLHLLLKPSTPFDGLLFKNEALKRKMNLKLLSDYSFSEQSQAEKIIFLSFSSTPEEKIDSILHLLFE
ncbi:MAG: PLP-dependent aminotransferase family protein, partial [Atopostipes suicloacalis]|nr:PLP-dependent aminotransferase family protein [Atopostipes suicloacalis]